MTSPQSGRFVLNDSHWQRGYDLAIEQADIELIDAMTNPFDPDRGEFFGFEEGREDARKLKGAKL